jgi:hypothetical protein
MLAVGVTSTTREGRTPSPRKWLRQVPIPSGGEDLWSIRPPYLSCPPEAADCPIYRPRESCLVDAWELTTYCEGASSYLVDSMALYFVVKLCLLVFCGEPRSRLRARSRIRALLAWGCHTVLVDTMPVMEKASCRMHQFHCFWWRWERPLSQISREEPSSGEAEVHPRLRSSLVLRSDDACHSRRSGLSRDSWGSR